LTRCRRLVCLRRHFCHPGHSQYRLQDRGLALLLHSSTSRHRPDCRLDDHHQPGPCLSLGWRFYCRAGAARPPCSSSGHGRNCRGESVGLDHGGRSSRPILRRHLLLGSGFEETPLALAHARGALGLIGWLLASLSLRVYLHFLQ